MDDLEQIETQALTTLDSAKALTVTNAEEYTAAGEFILGAKALVDKIKSEFAEPKKKAFEAHKAIVAMEANALAPVNQAINAVSSTALAWKREEDRKAKEEHDRQEALRRAAMEKQKLEEAAALEQWGETQAAEQKLREAISPIRPAKFESVAPKVAGLSTRQQWKARILAPSKVNRAYCLPDQTLVNRAVQNFYAYNKKPTDAQVQALLDEIGGVEIYLDEGFAGRRA